MNDINDKLLAAARQRVIDEARKLSELCRDPQRLCSGDDLRRSVNNLDRLEQEPADRGAEVASQIRKRWWAIGRELHEQKYADTRLKPATIVFEEIATDEIVRFVVAERSDANRQGAQEHHARIMSSFDVALTPAMKSIRDQLVALDPAKEPL